LPSDPTLNQRLTQHAAQEANEDFKPAGGIEVPHETGMIYKLRYKASDIEGHCRKWCFINEMRC